MPHKAKRANNGDYVWFVSSLTDGYLGTQCISQCFEVTNIWSVVPTHLSRAVAAAGERA